MSAVTVSAFMSLVSSYGNDKSTPCVGYLVTNAGDSSFNGCYRPQKSISGSDSCTFTLDDEHQLYAWPRCNGVWRLGLSGVNVSYEATRMSSAPPVSEPGCGQVWTVTGNGLVPCPGVARVGLPPLPPTPGPPAPPPTAPAPPARLVWEEQFDQPELNTSRWNILEQVHRGGVYTRENVALVDGALQLRTVAQNLTIEQGGKNVTFYVTSGAVNTSQLYEQRLGRWEVTVKLPHVALSRGYTLHSSIWLFDTSRDMSRTGCSQEIDVVEQYAIGEGQDIQSRAAANLHPFTGDPHHSGQPCAHHKFNMTSPSSLAIGDWTTNWTTFTVDWTEGWIAMRVNGQLYASFAVDEGFSDPLFLALTACVMYRVPTTADNQFPLYYMIDSVRVYEWM